jgi:hypothetical protein
MHGSPASKLFKLNNKCDKASFNKVFWAWLSRVGLSPSMALPVFKKYVKPY